MRSIRYVMAVSVAALGFAGAHCTSSTGPSLMEQASSVTAAATKDAGGPECDLKCGTQQHRSCEFNDTVTTLCGPCQTGFVANAAGVCEPLSKCADACPHQACTVVGGTAACGTTCDAGYVFDTTTGKCRAPTLCGTDVTCTGGMQCVGGSGSTDGGLDGSAVDSGNAADAGDGGTPPAQDAVCKCPTGAAFDPSTSTCQSCGDTSPTCDPIFANGACRCAPPDNTFVPLSGGRPVPCDKDGDGWVNAEAAQVIEETTDPVVRAQARCHVHRVSKITLQGDDGATTSVDVTVPGELSLPLYEDESLDDPAATDRIYVGASVNSLTKACAPVDTGAVSDSNANEIADVHESPSSDLTEVIQDRPLSPKMAGYYGQYLKYSYYLELDNGWYEEVQAPGSTTKTGVYHIAERRRIDGTSTGVPLVDSVPAESSDFFRVCPRRADVLANAALPGYDFSDKKEGAYALMGHHSQFKCVMLVNADKYTTTLGANESSKPEYMAMSVDSNAKYALSRTAQDGSNVGYPNWVVKTCTPTASTMPPPDGVSVRNPSYPVIGCQDGFGADGAPPFDVARWVVVDGLERDDKDADRGCANLCRTPQNGGCDKIAQCSSQTVTAPPSAAHAAGFPACNCLPDFELGDGVNTKCACVDGTTAGTDPVTGAPACLDVINCTPGNTLCSPNSGGCQEHKPTKADMRPYYCAACNTGYEGDGVTCTPIDACAKALPNVLCNHLQQCATTGPGTSTCVSCGYGHDSVQKGTVPAGGENTCDFATNHCACGVNQACNANASTGWSCACIAGTVPSGSGCCPSGQILSGSTCITPNACTNVHCGANAHCVSGGCVCNAGYELEDGVCLKKVNNCPCGGTIGKCLSCNF